MVARTTALRAINRVRASRSAARSTSQRVRKEITNVMEGGEKAFRLRKEKYGF